MAKVDWQEHFRTSIKNAEGLYSKDTTNISFLHFCLRSKVIPADAYLDWAKENYQLPVLSENYFKTHKPQQEFYSKWQKTYPWSAECLPIAEWDGALIVACLQLPDDYKHTQAAVFVLTSHEVLDNSWNIYQKSSQTSETDFMDITKLAATLTTISDDTNFFDADGKLVLEDTPPKEEASETTIDEIEDEENSPDGLLGDISEQKMGPRSVEPITTAKMEFEDEKTTIDTNPPLAPVKATMSTNNMAAYLIEKIRKQGQDLFDKEVLASLQLLKTFFKKSMLLAIGDKDQLIKPILWDNSFNIQKPQTTEFNLKAPSIFKIVSNTQKPYHGFVVLNDINEAFFESWSQGQIPNHVTIVPVLDGDLLVGMLMGFGEKSSYNKNVLQFTENVAKELSQKIFKNSNTKAA